VIAPAFALGGPVAVQLFVAGLAALGFVLAAVLARRLVPEPWATRGALLVAVSPPALAYGTAVYPELVAGAALAGAALLALRVRERPRLLDAYGAALLLAFLPWLGPKFLIPALPIGFALVRWTLRRGRRLVALVSGEVVVASLVAYISVNDVLYGGLTPYAADVPGETATDASFPGGYLERAPRLVALWLDREYGLLRWAPVMALAFFGAFLLWRSRRERLARVLPGRLEAEIAATLLLAVCAGQVAVAAFGAPTMYGFWFPGRHLVAALPCAAALAAWGLRHAGRAGAVLAVLTVVASGWLAIDLATGHADGWVAPRSDAPWASLVDVFPLYGVDSAWADAVAAGVVVALVLLAFREWRSWRHSTGATARAYSP
jgi:hypothetical protein